MENNVDQVIRQVINSRPPINNAYKDATINQLQLLKFEYEDVLKHYGKFEDILNISNSRASDLMRPRQKELLEDASNLLSTFNFIKIKSSLIELLWSKSSKIDYSVLSVADHSGVDPMSKRKNLLFILVRRIDNNAQNYNRNTSTDIQKKSLSDNDFKILSADVGDVVAKCQIEGNEVSVNLSRNGFSVSDLIRKNPKILRKFNEYDGAFTIKISPPSTSFTYESFPNLDASLGV